MLTIGASSHQPLAMPWRNAIAVGRAYDLVRTDLLEHLTFLQRTIGYRYCRFHAVFDDDMAVVVAKPGGGVAYQWRQVDLVYDRLLAIGLKPFVELNPMPALLASGAQTMFHFKMNVTPPKDYAAWTDLVAAFTRHLVDRYGLEEVRSWYFEVWNEPNLAGFWSGTQAEYWQLYDASARAVKSVDALLRIGGPATSKANWIAEMIQHCVDTGVPLDFVSTHLYPQDEYVDYHDRQGSPHGLGHFFIETVRHVQDIVRASARPDLEIHWTEWNAMACNSTAGISWTHNPTNDALHGAALVVSVCTALDRAADTMCWWVGSDIFVESGLSLSPYSFTYGLLTLHGIPKAAYHAFAFLKKMQGDLLTIQRDGARALGAGIIATSDGQSVRLLAWNQRFLEEAHPETWRETVRLPWLSPEARVVCARIRAGAGSAYETWQAMGRPQNLSPNEEAALHALAEPAWSITHQSAVDGSVTLSLDLSPGEVLYIEVREPGESALPRSASPHDLAAWNAGMGDKSR